jgi:outer membrane protein assembly factor BamB/mono/diheme cytochrome c family protein
MLRFALPLAAVSLLAGTMVLAQETNPYARDEAAAAAGGVIFASTCAGCHGPAGTGGTAPPLDRALKRGDSDSAIFRIIREGLEGTAMPAFPALSEDNSWRVATYVRLISNPATPLVAANAGRGEQLFFGRGGCTACHEVDGLGRDFASDLSAIGLKPQLTVREGMGHSGLAMGPGLAMRYVTVTTTQGARLEGVVRAEDLATLHLKQRNGELTILARSAVRSISDAANPLLPPPIDDGEKDDILAYLMTRKARNLAETTKLIPPALLPFPRIATPEPRNWPTHRGTLDGANFSAQTQIGARNAASLQARWTASLTTNVGDGAAASAPLVVDGVLYVTSATGNVLAFDARSGLPIWRFARQAVLQNTGPVSGNRGVALLDGRLFVGTADNKLIALDAHSGRQLWEKQAASTLDGYAMGGAPLALRSRVVVGVNGGGAKARGWLDAYDPANGAQLWRLETVATPNQAGAMTGAVGAYEPQNVTLYWSTTRASDDGNHGDSILALNGNSAEIAWQHKLKPGAGGDGVVLAEQTIGGRQRALLLHLGRDGLFTVLDRGNGGVVQQWPLSETRVEHPSLSFDRSSGIAYAGLSRSVGAIDTRSGKLLWRTPMVAQVRGVLATRGGVVFVGLENGQLLALDMAGGKLLWNFSAAGPIAAAPVTYAVDGKQFLAVTAGNMLYAFALPG